MDVNICTNLGCGPDSLPRHFHPVQRAEGIYWDCVTANNTPICYASIPVSFHQLWAHANRHIKVAMMEIDEIQERKPAAPVYILKET